MLPNSQQKREFDPFSQSDIHKQCTNLPSDSCPIDRVVVRSRSQIVKPDVLFVAFLGIKWAHDIVKINRS